MFKKEVEFGLQQLALALTRFRMVIRNKTHKAAAKAKARKEAEKPKAVAAAAAAVRQEPRVRASLMKRVFVPSAELEIEEHIDALYWMRQALGLAVGLLYGCTKVTGQVGVSTFLCLSLLGPPSLLRKLHPFDEDEVGKVGSISTEGAIPSFALFLLTWIISYTACL